MGRIAIVDRTKRASLKMGCSWSFKDASDADTASYLKIHDAKIQAEINNSKVVGYPRLVYDLNLQTVESLYSSSGQKFVDTEFPPFDQSLFKSGEASQPGTSASKGVKHPPIEWKRSFEFLGEKCKVFDDKIEPGDIRQGALGDCWFLCAVAAIAEFPHLVRNLLINESDAANNHGAYIIQFCKLGFWTKVRVDDFFPCYPGGGPIYSRAHGPELWVLLVEKAFAKYCGSYEAIKSGWAFEAMIDLTGAPFLNFRFDDADVQEQIKNGTLWAHLKAYDPLDYIMSASTPGEDVWTEFGTKPKKEGSTGLVAGHAYTLIMVRESKYGPKLVKLRNPWGSMEWSGDWSDTSPLWTKEMQEDIEPLVQEDDGTFWMCFEDMLKYFNGINVCMVRGTNTPPWFEARRRFFFDIEGEGEEKYTSSPHYILKVEEPGGAFFFSVHQEDVRKAGSDPYIDFGVTVLQEQHLSSEKLGGASEESRTHKFIGGTGIAATRQSQVELDLPAGTYFVVPVSTGCKLELHAANYEAQEKASPSPPKKLLITDATGAIVDFTDEVYRVYTEIFKRMDVDSDGYLSKQELDEFMVLTEGKKVSEEAFNWMVNQFGTKHVASIGDKGGISLDGFLRAQLFVQKQVASDEEKLRSELALLGYDANLRIATRREAALVIHSEKAKFSLEIRPFDRVVFDDATELVIRKNGKKTVYEGGKIAVYVHKSGYSGVSILVENAHSSALHMKMDCSKSVNVYSHRGTLSHEETIAPGADVIMHHLTPANDRAKWSWTYSISFSF